MSNKSPKSNAWRKRVALAAAAGLLASPFAINIGATSASAATAGEPGYTYDNDEGTLGYFEAASYGGVFTHGKAKFFGSMGGTKLNSPIVGIATNDQTSSQSGVDVNSGYYLVAADGGVFSFGEDTDPGGAYAFHGSTGNMKLNSPIVAMAAVEGGYYLVAADGGVFTFGEGLEFYGSVPGLPEEDRTDSPIVGISLAHDPDEPGVFGYYLAAADGTVYGFGSAANADFPEAGPDTLNAPIVGIQTDFNDDGDEGIYLAAADGGIFSFGGVPFSGSAGGIKLNQPIVGFSTGVIPSNGYTLVASDGGVFNYGDQGFYGSEGATKLNQPVVGIAAF